MQVDVNGEGSTAAHLRNYLSLRQALVVVRRMRELLTSHWSIHIRFRWSNANRPIAFDPFDFFFATTFLYLQCVPFCVVHVI